MNKIILVLQREILVRIRKKSFILMTIFTPFLLALIMVVPLWLHTKGKGEKKIFYVCDNTGRFSGIQYYQSTVSFSYQSGSLTSSQIKLLTKNYAGVISIPEAYAPKDMVKLFTEKQLSVSDKLLIKKNLYDYEVKKVCAEWQEKNQTAQISQIEIKNIFAQMSKTSDSSVAASLGMFLSVVIYIFIFIYGMQVMRGVMEEKTGRVVEVLISSLKPFQLMAGKILGIACVSVLQFLIWALLGTIVSVIMKDRFGRSIKLFEDGNIENTLRNTRDISQALEINEMIDTFKTIPLGETMLLFAFFFLGGYLLFSSAFAAIGALCDNETDTQQFIFPVTAPLFLSFLLGGIIMEEPHGAMARFLSVFPFTSPVVMMMRLPHGVPRGEIFLSVFILAISVFIMIWFASKIYSFAILIYGKKIGYKEVLRLLF